MVLVVRKGIIKIPITLLYTKTEPEYYFKGGVKKYFLSPSKSGLAGDNQAIRSAGQQGTA